MSAGSAGSFGEEETAQLAAKLAATERTMANSQKALLALEERILRARQEQLSASEGESNRRELAKRLDAERLATSCCHAEVAPPVSATTLALSSAATLDDAAAARGQNRAVCCQFSYP